MSKFTNRLRNHPNFALIREKIRIFDVEKEKIVALKSSKDQFVITLQYDAAKVPEIASKKAPETPVAGKANVFVFSELNTANTTYKAAQRSAGVLSVRPILQELGKPVNDLSRGANVEDIVFTIAITAIQG